MVTAMISGGLRIALWSFAALGVATLLLTGMIAWPVRQPPELASISDSRKLIDFDTLPAVDRFQARDGTDLGYRHYSPRAPVTDRIAIVVHGSSGSNRSAIHALSNA